MRRLPLTLIAVLVLIGNAVAIELRPDTNRAVVPLDEIIPGGPPPDGIPAIDHPTFVTPAAAAAWLRPKEPVLAVQIGDDTRAYPLQILMWHEIVNDTVGGRPVVITYCPLCNSGIVFDRTVADAVLDFGTSGKLYRSDLVMYDRQSQSLWAQMEGRAIVGARAGTQLTMMPANTLAFETWRGTHPDGKVLSRVTGYHRSYGTNPYADYDEPMVGPFLYRGQLDPRRPPKERVVGVQIGDTARAYPWPVLKHAQVINDTLAGEPIVVLYQPGTLSALDQTQMEQSRDVGAATVFSRRLGDRVLTFEAAGASFRDRETGSLWNLLGVAQAGPHRRERLRAIPHIDAFWFAWAAFHPTTSIHTQ